MERSRTDVIGELFQSILSKHVRPKLEWYIEWPYKYAFLGSEQINSACIKIWISSNFPVFS